MTGIAAGRPVPPDASLGIQHRLRERVDEPEHVLAIADVDWLGDHYAFENALISEARELAEADRIGVSPGAE